MQRPVGGIALERLDATRFRFLAPRCAQERSLDFEEALEMREAGEFECARDECLFLVEDCRAFWSAYNLLAELALEDGDVPLAQGYFGFPYESGLAALPQGFRGVLPKSEGYNGEFFAAGRGVARCQIARGDLKSGREVLLRLQQLDPHDAETADLLTQLAEREAARPMTDAGLPIVELGMLGDDQGDDEPDEA